MLNFFKRIRNIEESHYQMRRELDELRGMLDERGFSTVSERTTAKEPPVPARQILDEWLNGEARNNV